MKYDYMIQFARLANDESEHGKIRNNIISSFLKDMPIKQGTMRELDKSIPGFYNITAQTQQNDDIKFNMTNGKLTIDITGKGKKLTSKVDCDKKEIITSGFILDEKGIYLFDGLPDKENSNQNVKFIVSFFDMEAINYINGLYSELLSSDLKIIREKVKMGYATSELIDIKIIQDMISGKMPVDNTELREAFLNQGIQPDEEIEKEVSTGEVIQLSTTLYRIEPSVFMLDNKQEMTM